VSTIHPTAIVSPSAEIGRGVSVGPYSVIESDVRIGDGCQLSSHVVIKRGTTVGADNRIAERAILGGLAQHIHAPDEPGQLEIGEGNIIREQVTIHRALKATEVTVIGGHNMIMVGAHIGHDCRIGNHTIIVNNVMLAGHVEVHDRAYLSGAVAIHQFCRVGRYAMVGGLARIRHDILPFLTVDGETSRAVGLNLVGMRRNGFSRAEVAQAKEAYRTVYRRGLTWEEICETLGGDFLSGPAAQFHEFLVSSRRGIIQQRSESEPATLKLHMAGQDSSDQHVSRARKAG